MKPTAQIAPELIEKALDVDFAEQVEKTFAEGKGIRGNVVKGLVTSIEGDYVIIDVGMKAEGRVNIREFCDFNKDNAEVKVGDEVDVFLENMDNRYNEAQLSRERAKREEVLDSLEQAAKDDEVINGIIFGKVKGGFMVDVQGILGFMPGSQLDARPITDVNPYMHNEQDLKIVKLDRQKNNLIVSRRAVQDAANAGNREELMAEMEEGKVIKGVVKNITDYGAFIDLGGIDGLLHITDIAWHRINHPSEILTLGETIDVQVIRFDQENQRVSLGIKQLQNDPWSKVENDFPLEGRVTGKVTNITDYGAFVELSPGIEGLIHVSEMSWTRKNVHPGKILSTSQEVEVMVLEIEREKRRISLGLKQCQDNPWQAFAKDYSVGDKVEGTIRSVTDFGVFVGLTDDIDGLVHVSDLTWEQAGEETLTDYRKGETLEALILALDPEKERIALGVKQLGDDPLGKIIESHKKGQVVKVTVKTIEDDGLVVDLNGFDAYIRRRDLAVDRTEQDPSHFKEGQVMDAKLINLNAKDRKISLSVKALQVDEEKAAVAAYSEQSEDGDSALAAALRKAGVSAEEKVKAEKPKKKAAAKKSDTKKAPAKKAPAKKADKVEKVEDKKADAKEEKKEEVKADK